MHTLSYHLHIRNKVVSTCNYFVGSHLLYHFSFEIWAFNILVAKQLPTNVCTYTWKKHVYSILAKERLERRRERTSSTHKTQKTQHTKQKNKKAGPWVPSLENWGGRLKSLYMYIYMYLRTVAWRLVSLVVQFTPAFSMLRKLEFPLFIRGYRDT